MAIKQWIDVPARTVRLEATGETTPEEWTAAMHDALESPEYQPGFGFLSDRRAAEPATVPFTDNALAFVTSNRRELAGARFAVVVSNANGLEMARLGKKKAYDSSLPIFAEIFSDLESAQLWLRLTAFKG